MGPRGLILLVLAVGLISGCIAKERVSEEEARSIAEDTLKGQGIQGDLGAEQRMMQVESKSQGGYRNFGFVVNESYDCEQIIYVSEMDGSSFIQWRCTSDASPNREYILYEK